MVTDWKPDLAGRKGPKYQQIVAALEEDIRSGVLQPGDRLPPHRELAWMLELSPNTTSRACAEAVRRGLVRGETGRGTWVCNQATDAEATLAGDLVRPVDSGPVDLSRNLMVPGLAGGRLAATCAEIGLDPSADALADYQTDADPARHARAAALWLERHGITPDPAGIVITAGSQQGIFCSLMGLLHAGELLLVEALSYAPVRAMAARLGLKVASVALDDQGLCPDTLERLCRERAPKALYMTPTLHTPTGVTMPADRRAQVAAIARKYDLILIEDDVFGLLHPDRPAPVACQAPERSVFLTSVSKCLAPGLRTGFVQAPPSLAGKVRGALNLSCWMTTPMTSEIVARWIDDGTADALTEQQIRMATHRQTLARTLPGLGEASPRFGLHTWLPLPADWTAEQFCSEAARRNVRVNNGSLFALPGHAAPAAVRICLGHEAREDRLRGGLQVLKEILEAGPATASLVL